MSCQSNGVVGHSCGRASHDSAYPSTLLSTALVFPRGEGHEFREMVVVDWISKRGSYLMTRGRLAEEFVACRDVCECNAGAQGRAVRRTTPQGGSRRIQRPVCCSLAGRARISRKPTSKDVCFLSAKLEAIA